MATDSDTSYKRDLKRGFAWFGAAQALSRVADLGSLVVVLWFLTKGEIGLATLSWSIAVVLEAFSGMGIGTALVQAKTLERKQLDASFWYTMGLALALFGALSAAAPWIADLYGEPELAPMIIVSSSKLLLVGAALVPLQLLNRALKFRTLGVLNVIATLASSVVKIAMAATGFGAWALVVGHMSFGVALLLAVIVLAPWWPRLSFAWHSIATMAGFGARVALSRIIFHAYRNADYLLIGHFIGKEGLGVYRVAFEIAMTPAEVVLQVIGRAAFPVFARLNDARQKLADAFVWTTRGLAFVLLPIAVFLWFVAPHIVWVVGDGKWVAAAPVVRLLAGAAALRSLTQLFPQLFHATRPSLAIYESIASALVLVVAFTVALSGWRAEAGVQAIGWAWLISYPLLWGFAWALARNVIPMPLSTVARSMRDPLLVAALTAAVLLPVHWLATPGQHALAITALQGTLTAAAIFIAARLLLRRTITAPPPI